MCRKCCNPVAVSHKCNPSSIPQGYMDSHSTLPWFTWEVVTGVKALEKGIPINGGSNGEPGREFIYQGLKCSRRVWKLSPYRPHWEPGGGVHLPGTLRGLWKLSISLWKLCYRNLEGGGAPLPGTLKDR